MQIYLPVGFIENGEFTPEQLEARTDVLEELGIEQRLQIQLQEGFLNFSEKVAQYLNGAIDEPLLFHDRHGYISEKALPTIVSDLETVAHFGDKARLKQPPIVTYHGPMMFASWEEAVLEHEKRKLPLEAPTYTAKKFLSEQEKSLLLLGKIKRKADKLGIEVLLENVPGLDYVYKAGTDTRDKRWKGTGWLPELIDLGALYVTAEGLNYAFENLGIASAVDIEHLVFTYGKKHSEGAINELKNVRVAHVGAANRAIVMGRIGSHLPFIGDYPLVDWDYLINTFPKYLRALMDKGVKMLVHEHHLGFYKGKEYVKPTVESIRQLQYLIVAAENLKNGKSF